MQTIVEQNDIEATLNNFAHGMMADHYCWRDWFVMSVSTHPALRGLQQGKLVVAVRNILGDRDGTIVWSEDGFLLSIFHGRERFDEKQFRADLVRSLFPLKVRLEIKVHSAADEPAEVLAILGQQLSTPLPSATKNAVKENGIANAVYQYEDLIRMWDKTREDGAQRKKPHILVVDDDAVTRTIISHALKEDYALLTAETAVEAARKHILFSPNIIFLDVDLPDFDGFEFLRHIRQYDDQTQVVMFSCNSYLSNRLKAFEFGATGFVPKPFHRPEFEHYISQWRKLRRARRI